MDPNREEKIRHRAHQMWEEDGRPDGREAEHWERARREVDGDGNRDGDNRDGGRGVKQAANQTLEEASGSSGVAADLQSGAKQKR
jgi:hypothetical protein